MPSTRTILNMALITVGTMFALNSLAGASPQVRQILRGPQSNGSSTGNVVRV